eukprot:scaffold10582_cov60-Attheya_sp.AAC.3
MSVLGNANITDDMMCCERLSWQMHEATLWRAFDTDGQWKICSLSQIFFLDNESTVSFNSESKSKQDGIRYNAGVTLAQLGSLAFHQQQLHDADRPGSLPLGYVPMCVWAIIASHWVA